MGLSCRDNDAVFPYVVAIKELLESSGKKFNETKKIGGDIFIQRKSIICLHCRSLLSMKSL